MMDHNNRTSELALGIIFHLLAEVFNSTARDFANP
jgi:hypothetical protein